MSHSIRQRRRYMMWSPDLMQLRYREEILTICCVQVKRGCVCACGFWRAWRQALGPHGQSFWFSVCGSNSSILNLILHARKKKVVIQKYFKWTIIEMERKKQVHVKPQDWPTWLKEHHKWIQLFKHRWYCSHCLLSWYSMSNPKRFFININVGILINNLQP